MTVEVSCGYRIHINSIDMNGFNRRVCGGVGFCLENPRVYVVINYADQDLIQKGMRNELVPLIKEFRERQTMARFYKIYLTHPIHRHKGLGSTTILKLSVLRGLYELAGKPFTKQLANSYRIGLVSGITFNAFFDGGFVVDGGYQNNTLANKTLNGESIGKSAPLLFRKRFPDDWLIYLAIPKKRKSLNGKTEAAFFDRVTPIPNAEVYKIAYHLLLGVLPSLFEKELGAFIEGINNIVAYGTKPFELALHGTECKALINRMQSDFGFAAVSSLGPSVYTITNGRVDIEGYRRRFKNHAFYLTKVSNVGHQVRVLP